MANSKEKQTEISDLPGVEEITKVIDMIEGMPEEVDGIPISQPKRQAVSFLTSALAAVKVVSKLAS